MWLITPDQKRYRIVDRFSPSFYAHGTPDALRKLAVALAPRHDAVACTLTERTDLWQNRAVPVAEVRVAHPAAYHGWARWVRRFDSSLQLYNSDLMPATLYCWQRGIFPLARVEVEVEPPLTASSVGAGCCPPFALRAIECRDDEWAPVYETPPLKIMQLRLRRHSRHGGTAALEVQVEDECCEIDESGDPTALTFARLVKRHDPDLLLTDWGDATILPLLSQQARRLGLRLPLNRDAGHDVQQSRARSFMSYGRILFKDSATTLFGRLHVDSRNSFMADKCDLPGLWELVRVTRLPVQYAARTTTGTGISYMQMEMAWRDGVLIPEQKAEPEDPKQPDEMLLADRGGLVFFPKLGLHDNVAELDFVSEYPSIMARFNISPETVNCPCCPGAPRVPELGYRICQQRRGITSRVVERLIAKRERLKHIKRTADAEGARVAGLQRDALKWLLVCCFGYTGYRNARFGKIEAHEAINAVARETLLVAKEMAEDEGYELLHALVDSLYVRKPGATPADFEQLAQRIAARTSLPIAIEAVYRYVVFLPSKQYAGVPVPNRFFAVRQDGELKVRGLELRRHDTPALITRMQNEVLALLAEARDGATYLQRLREGMGVLAGYEAALTDGTVDVEDLVIRKRLTRAPRDYQKASLTAVAAQQLFTHGVELRPGETVEYVLINVRARVPNDRVRAWALWDGAWGGAYGYDRRKYIEMLREAFEPFVLAVPEAIRDELAALVTGQR